MAMAVEKSRSGAVVAEGELQIALRVFQGDEFLEQKRLRGDGVNSVALEQALQFVAKGKKTRRLNADDGDAALSMWAKRGDNA